MDKLALRYYYGHLEEEWSPQLDELVDIEVFCGVDCAVRAANQLVGRDGWRRCEDRVNIVVGPEVEGNEGKIFLVELVSGDQYVNPEFSYCGCCDASIV